MSTVAISDALKQDVRTQIRQMADADMKAMFPEDKELSTLDASELLTRLSMFPNSDLYDVVPETWLETMQPHARNVILVKQRQHKFVYGQVSDHVLRAWLQNQPIYGNVRWPTQPRADDSLAELIGYIHFPESKHAKYRHAEGNQGGNNRTEITTSMLEHFKQKWPDMKGLAEVEEMFRLAPELQALRDKWRSIEVQVMEVLSARRTVNQAIKAVPSVKLYLPDGTIARLNEVQPKITRERKPFAEITGINEDLLTSAGVAHLLDK